MLLRCPSLRPAADRWPGMGAIIQSLITLCSLRREPKPKTTFADPVIPLAGTPNHER
jgi:hypothetical protein